VGKALHTAQAANNAVATGTLVPLLTLRISTSGAVILLGAFQNCGSQSGLPLFQTRSDFAATA